QAPPLVKRTVEAELFGAAQRAVDGGPRHDLRVGEVLGAAAALPDAFVGALPDVCEAPEQRALERPARPARGQAAAAGLVQRVHDLAEDVELQLPVGPVADAD